MVIEFFKASQPQSLEDISRRTIEHLDKPVGPRQS